MTNIASTATLDATTARFSGLEIDLPKPRTNAMPAVAEVKADYSHLVGHYALKNCKTLGSIIDQVNATAKLKTDRMIPISEVRLDRFGNLQGMPLTGCGIQRTSRLTGVPKPMIDYLLAHDDLDTLVSHLNREFRQIEDKHPTKEYLMRMIQSGDEQVPNVRGLFSDQYAVIDNDEVMDMIRKALPTADTSQLLVSRFDDGEFMMTGTMFLPDRMVAKDDSEYGIGIAFRNSEVGRSSAQIKPFLFRSACLNGLIAGRMDAAINVRQMHYGKVDLTGLQDQISLAVHSALGHGEQLLNQLQAAKDAPVSDARRMIVLLADRFNLPNPTARNWYDGFLAEPDANGFGIVNGLTRAAQGYAGVEREELETVAGAMLAPSMEADLRQIVSRWERFEDQASEVEEAQVVKILALR